VSESEHSGASAYADARARSEAKNQAVRDSLEPLAEGERPLAVSIAAVLALLLAIGNLVAYLFADHASGPDRSREIFQTFLICAVLLAAAGGMWKSRYWAVLGFQTILGLQVIVLTLSLLRVSHVWVALLFLAIIALSSVLFWYLIRAMARIQMPQPPTKQRAEEETEAEDG
jgi:hypothetical protein